jgi:hypothetical protein
MALNIDIHEAFGAHHLEVAANVRLVEAEVGRRLCDGACAMGGEEFLQRFAG